VRRQTYGFLPGRKLSPPFGQYQIILLGDRATHVRERLVQGHYVEGRLAGNRTCDLLIISPAPCNLVSE